MCPTSGVGVSGKVSANSIRGWFPRGCVVARDTQQLLVRLSVVLVKESLILLSVI